MNIDMLKMRKGFKEYDSRSNSIKNNESSFKDSNFGLAKERMDSVQRVQSGLQVLYHQFNSDH